jgi:hypothetical protein
MKGLTSFRKGLKMADQRLLAWHPRRRAKTTNSEKRMNKLRSVSPSRLTAAFFNYIH